MKNKELNNLDFQLLIDLEDWTIDTLAIGDEQVLYPDDITHYDKYFIGINCDFETKTGTIYHGRELTEEDILHELLHIKYPNSHTLCKNMKHEDYEIWIQEQTLILLNQ